MSLDLVRARQWLQKRLPADEPIHLGHPAALDRAAVLMSKTAPRDERKAS
jgi:hypothetical protein